MILSSEIAIEPEENVGQLHDRLMLLGSEIVLNTLSLIEKGNVITNIQIENNEIKTAYKLNKENCKIDWTKTIEEIYNQIRGLSPYPAAWCFLIDRNEELNIKIYEANKILENHNHTIGNLISTKKEMKIAVKNGFIQVLNIQFPGKKKMSTTELLNGMAFSEEAKVY